MPAPTTYRGTITREQWLSREMRIVARLMLEDGFTDPAALATYVQEHNAFQYPTERELKSIARACIRRIASVSEDHAVTARLVELLAHGTADQLRQANLYAMMCDNRLVWKVHAQHGGRQAAQARLQPAQLRDRLVHRGPARPERDGRRLERRTRNKARQVLAKCIVECGMYDRRAEELTPLLADFSSPRSSEHQRRRAGARRIRHSRVTKGPAYGTAGQITGTGLCGASPAPARPRVFGRPRPGQRGPVFILPYAAALEDEVREQVEALVRDFAPTAPKTAHRYRKTPPQRATHA